MSIVAMQEEVRGPLRTHSLGVAAYVYQPVKRRGDIAGTCRSQSLKQLNKSTMSDPSVEAASQPARYVRSSIPARGGSTNSVCKL
jgi:hypothetical protein